MYLENGNVLEAFVIVGIGEHGEAILNELKNSKVDQEVVSFMKLSQLPEKITGKQFCMFVGDTYVVDESRFTKEVLCLDVTDEKISFLAGESRDIDTVRTQILEGLCSAASNRNLIGVDFQDMYHLFENGKKTYIGISSGKSNVSAEELAKAAVESIGEALSRSCKVYVNIAGNISLVYVNEVAVYIEEQFGCEEYPLVLTARYGDEESDETFVLLVIQEI